MLAKYIRENRPLKWGFHLIFIASLLLFVNEIYFFQSSQRLAQEFIEATKGLVLFEANLDNEIDPYLNSNLETYIIRTKRDGKEPSMEVLTNATSSTFFKLEHSKSIQTTSLKGGSGSKVKEGQVFFGALPNIGIGIKGKNFHPLTKKWAYWKIGFSLFQESFLLQKFGVKGWVLFVIFFVGLNTLFASMCRHATSGILSLRFFGLPNSTLIPLLILKNSLFLLVCFSLIGGLFLIAKISISPFVYGVSFLSALLLSIVWSFFSRFQLAFKG